MPVLAANKAPKIAVGLSFVYNATVARPYLKPAYFDSYAEFIPDYELFSQFQAKPPVVSIRRNSLKCDEASFAEFLQRRVDSGVFKQVEAIAHVPDCWRIEAERAVVGGLWEHHIGMFYMLGASSVVPVLALNPQPGERILDMCAAPGGKTSMIAQMMQDQGVLVANEPSDGRRRVLKFNLERMGTSNVVFTDYLGEKFPEVEGFDRILLDGPCSAEGSLRGSWSKQFDYDYNRAYRESLQRAQAKLLRRACDLLRPGGRLVYATCTYDPHENEEQVDALLRERRELTLICPQLPGAWNEGITHWQGRDYLPEIKNCKRIYPHRFDSWGFFFATFIKRS